MKCNEDHSILLQSFIAHSCPRLYKCLHPHSFSHLFSHLSVFTLSFIWIYSLIFLTFHLPLAPSSANLNPRYHIQCMNVIQNGKFSANLSPAWVDTSNVGCKIYHNNGAGILVDRIGLVQTLYFPPIADGLDVLAFTKHGDTDDQECRLQQSIQFQMPGNKPIVYAQVNWVDRFRTLGNVLGIPDEELKVKLAINNTQNSLPPATIMELNSVNTNLSTQLTKTRVANITSLLQGMSDANGVYRMALMLYIDAILVPIHYQWDNVELWVCLAEMPPDPEGGGDPHFRTWSGEVFTFHGVCDLVLLRSRVFGNGVGMDVHIRTKEQDGYSYIINVAVRIGNDVLEVTGNEEQDYFINGALKPRAGVDAPALSISGYPITISTEDSRLRSRFVIDLGDSQTMSIRVWKHFVTVKIHNGQYKSFSDSVGLMGSFGSGEMLDRKGKQFVIPADADEAAQAKIWNAYGQEWQVNVYDPVLFQTMSASQYPQQCHIPAPALTPKERRRLRQKSLRRRRKERLEHRRLDEDVVDETSAARACARVPPEDVEFCIYDVLATHDLGTVELYL
jgi:hypothetical protein